MQSSWIRFQAVVLPLTFVLGLLTSRTNAESRVFSDRTPSKIQTERATTQGTATRLLIEIASADSFSNARTGAPGLHNDVAAARMWSAKNDAPSFGPREAADGAGSRSKLLFSWYFFRGDGP